MTLWQFEGAVQDYLNAKSTWALTSAGGGGFVTPRMPKLVGRMQGPHRYALDL